jgi:DNA-binding CsgD family transcriptional regulator/PAS domain-containing protein
MPMMEVQLATRLISDVSDALSELTGYARDELVGSDPTRLLDGAPSPALGLLVSGQILGYETTTRLRRRDGGVSEVHVWAHALDPHRPPRTGLLVVDDESTAGDPTWTASVDALAVLGTVDAEWRIDRLTAGVCALLGYDASSVVGQPFLGAVHPGDIADLLTGLGHAVRSGHSVVVRVRLQGVDGGWHWCRACLAALPESSGFAFLVTPVSDSSGAADLAHDLQERLARIGYEVQAARALPRTGGLPTVSELPGLEKLTAREIQILTQLRAGSRSSDIAQSLSLAQSTVRNHLTSVYRKLGVTSQVGLLAALNGHARPA